MSFLSAVNREITTRTNPKDPIRVTLEYLLKRGVGRRNSVTLDRIVAHLANLGIHLSNTQFQQTVLAESRRGDFFIGSGRRGYFLIDTEDDAREMAEFYETRIRAEQENLDNLRRQARIVGWTV